MKRLWIAALMLAVCLASAAAQEWPAQPLRIVVPFGPGSTPDIVARLVGERLQGKLGVSVVIENKPGASGNIGTDAIAKADPDGYTIGISIGGPLTINRLLFAKLPYDPATDLAPITQLVTQPSILAVNAALEVSNVAELIALIRKEPAKFNYASIGNGSLSHLAMEALAQKSGAQLVHVPYPGSPQAVTALLRADVQMGCLPGISVAAQATSGQIRMLAVSTAQRSPYLPDVPTLRESGIDVEADAWNGLIAPAKTPADIIARIQRKVADILKQSDIRDKLAAQLMEPVGSTPAEFRAKIEAEAGRWEPVIKAANIRIN